MKLYFHFSLEGFSNCYILGNDESKEAIIIDPGYIDPVMISHIENNGYKPIGILITHNHDNQTRGINTLLKIYKMPVIGADYEICGHATTVVSGEGILQLGYFKIEYYATPGHSSDSMLYKIGSMLFTGDSISSDCIGSTNSDYGTEILRNTVNTCLKTQNTNLLVFPSKGPPSTLEAELKFNTELKNDLQNQKSTAIRDY